MACVKEKRTCCNRSGTPGRVLFQLEELYPSPLAEIEQPELGHDDGGLEERVALHPPEPADRANSGCGVALDLVAGESFPAVLDGQGILLHPHGDLRPRESLLGVEPEALQDEVADAVEGASVAGREERPG